MEIAIIVLCIVVAILLIAVIALAVRCRRLSWLLDRAHGYGRQRADIDYFDDGYPD